MTGWRNFIDYLAREHEFAYKLTIFAIVSHTPLLKRPCAQDVSAWSKKKKRHSVFFQHNDNDTLSMCGGPAKLSVRFHGYTCLHRSCFNENHRRHYSARVHGRHAKQMKQ